MMEEFCYGLLGNISKNLASCVPSKVLDIIKYYTVNFLGMDLSIKKKSYFDRLHRKKRPIVNLHNTYLAKIEYLGRFQ